MRLTLLPAAILSLGLIFPPLAHAGDDHSANDPASDIDAPAPQRWEFSILGGATLTPNPSRDYSTLEAGITHATAYASSYRLGYWMGDHLSLQMSAGLNAYGDLGDGDFQEESRVSGHALLGVGYSRALKAQTLSPFAAVNVGTLFTRDWDDEGLAPFLGAEGGVRYNVNDTIALRAQGGVKALTASSGGITPIIDVSLGVGARF